MFHDNKPFALPRLIFQTRAELIGYINDHQVDEVFENLLEVSNPRGLQWNLTLTALINISDKQAVIAEYNESYFDKFECEENVSAVWLTESCKSIKKVYKGKLEQ